MLRVEENGQEGLSCRLFIATGNNDRQETEKHNHSFANPIGEKLESRRRIMVIDPVNRYPLSDQSWGELGGHFMLRDLPYQSLYF